MSVPNVIGPPPGLMRERLGTPGSEVALVLHPAVAAVVREVLAYAVVDVEAEWSEADAAAMELVIAAIEAKGIQGCL